MKAGSIVIVDRNGDLREKLQRAFAERGYQAWSCPALDMATGLMESAHPNVVLIDLDGDFAELLETLARWRKLAPDARFIVESAQADALRMREAIAHGADAYLVKPFSLPPLFAMLEEDIPPPGPFTRAA